MGITDAQGNVFDTWQDLEDYWVAQYVPPDPLSEEPPLSDDAAEEAAAGSRASAVMQRFLGGEFPSLFELEKALRAAAGVGFEFVADRFFNGLTSMQKQQGLDAYDATHPTDFLGSAGSFLASPPPEPEPPASGLPVINAQKLAEERKRLQLEEVQKEAAEGGKMATPEAEGPFTRWLRYRGVGGAPGQIPFASRAARYLQSQYGRAQDLRDVQVPLYEDLGLKTRLPYEYATAFGDRAARHQQGRDVLATFFRMSPEQRQNLGYTFEPFYDVDQIGRNEGRSLETLQDLIKQGRGYLGRSTAGDYLASRVPFMRSQWETLQPSIGGVVTPFVDYLKAKFGL